MTEQKQAGSDAFRSSHTAGVAQILQDLHSSLLITSSQAGKVILARSAHGALNTHFRSFHKPAGLAQSQDMLAIATDHQLWKLQNVPAVCEKVSEESMHDACYLPRSVQITGRMDSGDMAFDRHQELWMVNTRFSCLCTLDPMHSFYPRWRPPFISELAAEDRCHLTGMAMVEGEPRFVTALGTSDNEEGWRTEQARGGVVIDVRSGEIFARGLSMPHSPRWHQGRLWVLESGTGSLGTVDLAQGKYEQLIELPGFTRGLCLVGPLAFVGVSTVRESAVLHGLPLADRIREKTCGIWVINTQAPEIIGFIRFESSVREIHSVEVLLGHSYPEVINNNPELLSQTWVLPPACMGTVKTAG